MSPCGAKERSEGWQEGGAGQEVASEAGGRQLKAAEGRGVGMMLHACAPPTVQQELWRWSKHLHGWLR
jgi:hypothetical protein